MSRAQLKELSSQLEKDELRIETITSSRTKLKKEQLAEFFATGRSLSPDEAKASGIVTSIKEFEVPDGAKKGIFNTFPIPDQGNIPNAPQV